MDTSTQPASLSSSIEVIKRTRFLRRKHAFEKIQLHHASLSPPRRLKAEDNTCGTKVTYICADTKCKVRITIRRFRLRDAGIFWGVCNEKDDLWEHSPECEKVVSVPLSAAATLLKDVRASGKELINIMREKSFNFGGDEAKECSFTRREHVYANRIAKKIRQMRNEGFIYGAERKRLKSADAAPDDQEKHL